MTRSKNITHRLFFLYLLLSLTGLCSGLSAQSKYHLALQAASNYDFDQAIQQLTLQIAEDSSFTEAYLRLADFYRYANKLPEASSFFSRAILTNPRNPNLYLGKSAVAGYLRDWDEAFQQAKLAAENGSESFLVVKMLVDYALRSGRTDALPSILRKMKRRPSQKNLYDLGYAIWRTRVRNFRRARSTIASYLSNGRDAFGLYLLGRINQSTGRADAAISNLRTALQVSRPADQFQDLHIMLLLASAYFETSHIDSANYFFSEALTSARSIGALLEELQISLAYRDFLKNERRYNALSRLCRKGIIIATVLKDPLARQEFHVELGQASQKMGDFNEAVKQFKLCSQIDENLGNPALQAQCRGNLGRLLLGKETEGEAIDLLMQSTRLAREYNLGDIEHRNLLALADLERDKGDISKARTGYEQILRYGQKMRQYDLVQTCFTRLAFLYLKPDADLEKARYYLALADALARQTLQPHFAATNRWMQGQIALLHKDIERAETYFLDAIQLGTDTGAYSAVLAGNAGLIRTYRAAGFGDLVRARIDTTLAYLRDYGQLSMDVNTLEYFDLTEDLFIPAIQALSQRGDLSLIFDVFESSKAIRHFSCLSEIKYRIESLRANSIGAEHLIRDDLITAKWQEIWKLWGKDRGDNANLVLTLKDEISRIFAERKRMQIEMAEKNPVFASLFNPSTSSIYKLRENLQRINGVFLHYLVGEKTTNILLVRPDSVFYRQVELRKEDLRKMVGAISPVFHSAENDFAKRPFPVDISGDLYRQIFEPMRKWIPLQSNLIISADAPLHYLPFDGLVTNASELTGPSDYGNARFLVHEFSISYASSAQFLDWEPRGTGHWQHTFSLFRPEKLSGETEILSAMGKNREIREGANCNKEQFLIDASNSQIIQLDAPVEVEDRSPLYSRLIFRGAGKEEEVLWAYEMLSLKLGAELAVFNSVNWRGQNTNRNCGSLPILIHAWNCAGVPGIVANLWKTSDSSSRLLADFYLNLKQGQNKSVALRRAKLAFIDEVSGNPNDWASYMLYGDITALQFRSESPDFIIGIALIGSFALVTVLVVQYSRIRRDRRYTA